MESMAVAQYTLQLRHFLKLLTMVGGRETVAAMQQSLVLHLSMTMGEKIDDGHGNAAQLITDMNW